MRGLGDLVKAGLSHLGVHQHPMQAGYPARGCACPRWQNRLNRLTPGYRAFRAPVLNATRMMLSLARKLERPLEQGHERRVSFPGHRTVGHFPFSAYGASGGTGTVQAASLSDTDVEFAFAQIASDTVECLLPAGSAHWSRSKTLQLPAGIGDFALKGAGNLSVTGGGDVTTIIDDSPNDNQLIDFDCVTNFHAYPKLVRIAGMTFLWNINFAHVHNSGFIKYQGYNQLRVDHSTFRQINGAFYSMYFFGPTGVVDHNLCDVGFTAARNVGGAGTYGVYGDEMWEKPTNFGGADWLFVEDNQIATVAGIGGATGIITDCYGGSKLVIRYNQLESVETHGLDQDHGRLRGCRGLEVYKNTFTSTLTPPRFQAVDVNNGPNLVWGNTLAVDYQNFLSLRAHRSNDDGTDWPPRIFPDGHLVSGAPVSDGDWGYCGTSFSGTGSTIDSNGTPEGSDLVTGYPCLDQVGRGGGDLLQNAFLTAQSGSAPTIVNLTRGCNSSQQCIYPRQGLLPVYEWLTTGFTGSAANRVAIWQGIVIQENRDVYVDKGGAFNGTVGVGSGPVSARPSTCTPLVAYWATDEQKLYQCQSTNTWTFVYAPYPYPHPLTGAAPATPQAPTGMHFSQFDKYYKGYPP